MVRTAGSTLSLVLLVLAVLPDCPRAADCPLLHGDVHSIYYDFNISSNKQPWCMAQGQMDGKDFFSYDCGSDKVISMNLLREEVIGTETWKEQTKTLRDLGNSFKGQLPDIKRETLADRGPFTLQARMTCHCNASGKYSGSWEFGWNGQRFFLFDLESGKYTVDHSGGEQMKDKWEKFKKVTQELEITLKGDCKKWLQHLVSWKEEPETAGAPIRAPATATPSRVAGAPITAPAAATPSRVAGAPIRAPAAATPSTVAGAPIRAPAAATPSTVAGAPIRAPAAATPSTVAGAPITSLAKATTSTVTASPATTEGTIRDIILIVFGVVLGVLLLVLGFLFLLRFHRSNRRCRSEAPEGVVSSCSPADLQELQSLQQMQRPLEDREDTADAIPTSFMA